MKIAEIDWQLFWHAFSQQDVESRDRWVGRWVFADAGVKLSMRPMPLEASSSIPNHHDEAPRQNVLSGVTASMQSDLNLNS